MPTLSLGASIAQGNEVDPCGYKKWNIENVYSNLHHDGLHKHDGFCSPYKVQIPRLRISGN